jgi:hypothetical protein
MESDSHKMETTTKETVPGSIGVDIIIPSEEGTVRPEGTTVSAREETELPEYVLPEEHVPYVPHLPEGHVPEQTTKLPEGAATEGYVTITKPAEHVPAHTEMPVEVITSAEGEIDTVPTIQEGSTEISVTEVGQEQSTEKHLEPKPVTEIAPEQVTEKHLEPQPATENWSRTTRTTTCNRNWTGRYHIETRHRSRGRTRMLLNILKVSNMMKVIHRYPTKVKMR